MEYTYKSKDLSQFNPIPMEFDPMELTCKKVISSSHWTLQQACEYFRTINHKFHNDGWLLGIYGSILQKGEGRDLDLVAFPWRPGSFCDYHLGNGDYSVPESGLMNSRSVVFRRSDGNLVDLQYRLLYPTTDSSHLHIPIPISW